MFVKCKIILHPRHCSNATAADRLSEELSYSDS